MRFTSFGAAREVTGSLHLLEVGERRILFDCGLFQDAVSIASGRNLHLPVEADQLDAVVLSHAHIDHCGRLPLLYRNGFRGPIFCSAPTADLTALMLLDSARVQRENQETAAIPHDHYQSLADERREIRSVMSLVETLEIGVWHDLATDFRLRLHLSGHILGSTVCELRAAEGSEDWRVVYSGDLGHRGIPLVPELSPIGGCDLLICESTYADQVHADFDECVRQLRGTIQRVVSGRGRLIVPAFSLGRTQQLLSVIQQLWQSQQIPLVPVFLDSPLSRKITEVYREYAELQTEFLQPGQLGLDYPELEFVETPQASQELNSSTGPRIVISASGMCEGGRIQHHLRHGLADPQTTVLFTGYQANGTLGRRLLEGAATVEILDHEVSVQATIEQLSGMSAHADAIDLSWWLEQAARDEGIGQLLAVHGELPALRSLCQLADPHCNDEPQIPEPGCGIEFEH